MNRLLSLIAPVMLIASPVLAEPEGHAADGAHEVAEKAGVLPTMAQGIVPMIVTLVVFAIVFAILSVAVWPKITKALHEREAKIRSEIESAETARQQAKAALDQYERALADARAEAQRELEKAKALQAQQLAEMKSKNDADMAIAKDKAMREIEAAKKLAIQEVYGQGAQLASMVAGRILQREINAGDQQRFVDEAVATLSKVSHN